MIKKNVFWLLSLAMVLASHCAFGQTKEKPNIIFIFADDQSFNAVHALGNTEVQTPHLDQLAENGVTFTHAYNMGAWNGAVCLASRSMLNTGRFVWRAHQAAKDHYKGFVDQEKFWGLMMKGAGYDTYMTGKWHVPAPADKVFGHAQHVRGGMPNQTPQGYNRPKSKDDKEWQPWDKKFGGFWKGGKHWSEVVGDDAVSFIEQAGTKEKPFFMYLAFNAPHDPRQSPKEFVDKYPVEKVKIPETFLPEYPYKDAMGCSKQLRDEKLAPFPRTEYSVKTNRQEYYAIITHMDDQIGRILTALEKSGKMDNTYIFFSADHGLACGNHGLMGKQNMYDHSVRVPLFVVGPDVPKNKKKDVQVYLQDIMASTLDLAHFEKPTYVEFNSLMPFVRGEQKRSNYPVIYGCYKDLQRMVRTERHKMILYPKSKTVLLYDLKKDPLELHNLADNKKSKKLVKKMFQLLLDEQKKQDDTLDLKNFYPEYL